jgi:hypothetical protein
MLDRLLHRSVVFNINGDSYRMRAHRARTERLSGRPGTREHPVESDGPEDPGGKRPGGR